MLLWRSHNGVDSTHRPPAALVNPEVTALAHPSSSTTFVHPAAEVSPQAHLGEGCRVWRQAHVREGAHVGPGCTIGAGVYVGADVRLGAHCKVQNQALLYEGVELEDGVFVGPQVCFTNDYLPRAVNPDGSLKSAADWHVGRTLVREGASVGAASVVVCGVTIGRWALVGAGSVVTRDVPDHGLVFGSPARLRGWVCRCARRLAVRDADGSQVGWCAYCREDVVLPAERADPSHPAHPERGAE